MKAKPVPNQDALLLRLAYDPLSGELRWLKTGKTAGCKQYRRGGEKFYITVRFDCELYLAHRLIWMMQTGCLPQDRDVDHRDTDNHNNKWSNLRIATKSENQHNRSGWRKRTLPKGVWKKGDGFAAAIRLNTTKHNLGTFPSLELAATAYKKAAVELHGEFARV